MANEIRDLLNSVGGVRKDWKADFKDTAAVVADWRSDWPVLVTPVNTVLPAITGTAQVGQTLTASTGTWTGGGLTYTYQWEADGVAVGGATSSTLVLAAGQLGAVMTVVVTATNNVGVVAAESVGTAAVIAA